MRSKQPRSVRRLFVGYNILDKSGVRFVRKPRHLQGGGPASTSIMHGPHDPTAIEIFPCENSYEFEAPVIFNTLRVK